MKKTLAKHCNHTPYIILICGALIRFIYVLFSTIYERQYDIGQFDLAAGAPVTGGHLGYIQYLFYYHHLPDVDPTTVYQFHHPPLHHILCSIWMGFMNLFTDNLSFIEESIQVIPFIGSLVTLYVTYKVLLKFDLSNKGLCIALTLFSFHPSLILMAGSVNNDCLALMFSFLCVYFALCWINTKHMKDIVLLALCLGLGISTKQNVAQLAFPIAAIFVIELLSRIKSNTSVTRLIWQYFVFGLVSIPLGMWFYIRNLIRYNMDILWVYELPTDSWQYTGDYPLLNRFLWPIPSELLDNLSHFRIGCGYNIWMQIIRTSMTGEWDMASVGKPIKLAVVLLMICGFALAIYAFVCFVKCLVLQSSINPLYRLFFIVSYSVIMLLYFIFVYKYPQECSMNFRYIELVLLFMITAVGMREDMKRTPLIEHGCYCIVNLFVLLSSILCVTWCFVA